VVSMTNLFGIEPLMPARGRDYKSRDEMQAAFDANRDLMTASGVVTSKQDLIDMGHTGTVSARWGRLQMRGVLFITQKEDAKP